MPQQGLPIIVPFRSYDSCLRSLEQVCGSCS
jgi:hypothetical protein